jgi:hypothetical protein
LLAEGIEKVDEFLKFIQVSTRGIIR